MPIFDFKCDECEIVEEHMVSSDTVVICPACYSSMIKLLSAPKLFILKEGIGGFHKPGYNL